MKIKTTLILLLTIALHQTLAEEVIDDDLRINGGLTIDDSSTLSLRNTQGTGEYAIHYANVAPRYPVRFVGSSDPNTHRFFEFGHYTGGTQSNTWNPQLVINSYTGRVGIGTITPQAKLHLGGLDGGTTLGVLLEGNNPAIRFSDDTNGSDFIIFDNGNELRFSAANGTFPSQYMVLDTTGNLGLGVSTPSHKLAVNGTIRAKEVIVDTGWPDFVFEDSYHLRSLSEVESHIREHGHLPDVPSASVVESEGLSVGEVQKIMMQKIEELTLYIIEQDKKIAAQQREIERLKSN